MPGAESRQGGNNAQKPEITRMTVSGDDIAMLDGATEPDSIDAQLGGGSIVAYTARSPDKETENEDTVAAIPYGHDAVVLAVADGTSSVTSSKVSTSLFSWPIERLSSPSTGLFSTSMPSHRCAISCLGDRSACSCSPLVRSETCMGVGFLDIQPISFTLEEIWRYRFLFFLSTLTPIEVVLFILRAFAAPAVRSMLHAHTSCTVVFNTRPFANSSTLDPHGRDGCATAILSFVNTGPQAILFP